MPDETYKPKYLAIKNWTKYQRGVRVGRTGRLPWVKDYTDREQDADYRALTMFQRGLLDGLCRLCGRQPSRLLHNDLTWIVDELHMLRTDRPHTHYALDTLMAHGFVFPTDNENLWNESAENTPQDERSERSQSGDCSLKETSLTSFGTDEEMKTETEKLPASAAEAEPSAGHDGTMDHEPDASPLAAKFLETLVAVGRDHMEYDNGTSRDRCTAAFEHLLKAGNSEKHILNVLEYLPKNDAFSRGLRLVKKVDPWDWFGEKFVGIAEAMDADEDFKQRRQKRIKEETAKTKDPEYHTGGKTWLT